jgi:hypothetical protein
VADGKYLFTETTPDSYTNPKWNADHPAVVGALSFVPGPGLTADDAAHASTGSGQLELAGHLGLGLSDAGDDRRAARRTGRAIDALLLDTPKNHYGLNGHVYQRPGLTIYLPANGGLLYATALMAAGWDGAPKRNAPGFPDNGQWNVRWENL